MGNSRAVPCREGTDPQHRFIHLVRLAWELRGLRVGTWLITLPAGQPVLEVETSYGDRLRVRAVRRAHGWLFTWRPWWSVLWRRDEWVWAADPYAAETIAGAAS